jgi:hypothetical protein
MPAREQDFPHHHRLDELWQMCTELLRELLPDACVEEIGHTTRLFREFCAVDPNVDRFRPPEDRFRNASLPARLDLDLGAVRAMAGKLWFFLDCIETSLTAKREAS